MFSELESVTSHKKIVGMLSDFFKKLGPAEAKVAAYLALGDTGPKYEDTDMGLGSKFALRAVALAYGKEEKNVKKAFDKKGDMGDTAAHFDGRKKGRLSVKEVHERLVKIRDVSGKGSHEKKIRWLSELLSDASSDEARYVMRIAMGSLRLGFGEQFLLEALGMAFPGKEGDIDLVKEKYNINTDIGEVAESLAKSGMSGIKRVSIRLGRPVQSMLAKRVDTIKELNKRFPKELAAEEKYDGERVQIHIDGNEVTLFSRRLEDITAEFPEIAEGASKAFKGKTAVLDGEIVAYDDGEFGSFQKLMQRRRKYDVKEYRKKIPASAFLFDLIYLEGRSLMKRPYPERREKLENNVRQNKNIKFTRRNVTSDFDEFEKFFKKCVDEGLEGVVVKSVGDDSVYQPGKRGFLWVKWKKEYAEGARDSFDLVVIGSLQGKGRRKEMFGALLCAALNKKKGMYESFTKVGSGFTDEQFDKIGKLLKKYEVNKKPANVVVGKDMAPDRYVQPKIVIEVIGSNITKSPKHAAGRGEGEKGYALRFPRFLHLRPDKSPDQATTIEEIKNMRKRE